MALVQCPECSAQVSTSALMCLSCGFPISKLRGLSVAIVLKDLEMVTDLIQLGADVNGLDKNGHTPLMNAASFGNIHIVETLLDAGAEPAFINSAGETAFTIATSKGDVEIEEILRKALDSRVPSKQDFEKTKEAEISVDLNLSEPFLRSNENEQTVKELATIADSNVEVSSVAMNEEYQDVEETFITSENIEESTINVNDQKTQEIITPVELNIGKPPTTIVESQPEPEESVGRFKVEPRFLSIDESGEVIESRKQSEALNCLECGGFIGPDEINCSHCHSLIMRRYCSHCSKLIPDHSTICPLCGENVTEHFLYASSRRGKILIGATVAVLAILLLLIVRWRNNSEEEIRSLLASPVDPKAEENFKSPIQTPKQNQASKLDDANDNRTQSNETKQLAEKEALHSAASEPKSQPSNTDLSNPALSASTQRSLELTDQQRIKRGRYLNSKGYSLIQQGRPSEAVPLLEQSVRSFPQGTTDAHYAYALFNLGHAYRIAGRPDLAIPILEERIKINNMREAVARELLAAKQQARNSDSPEPDYE